MQRDTYVEASEFKRFDDKGRQTNDDATRASPIRRVGMENAIGTADRLLVLGGFRRKDRMIADYSAGLRCRLKSPSLARSGAGRLNLPNSAKRPDRFWKG